MLENRAYLTGRSLGELETEFRPIAAIDRLVAEAATLNVAGLRGLLAQAQQAALGHQRLLFIGNAENLTEVMQNTLLKVLEEPNPSLVIVLQTLYPHRLLPTVISRLHQLASAVEASPVGAFRLKEDAASARAQLDSLGDREAIINALREEMMAARERILEGETKEAARKIELIDRAIFRLRHNANLKLVLDWFLLHWFED